MGFSRYSDQKAYIQEFFSIIDIKNAIKIKIFALSVIYKYRKLFNKVKLKNLL
jgi:hypothetical protein